MYSQWPINKTYKTHLNRSKSQAAKSSSLVKITTRSQQSIPDFTSVCSATYVRWQRGTARIRPPLLHQSIDISGTPGPQQQTYAHAGADRRKDTVPFHKPFCDSYEGSANKSTGRWAKKPKHTMTASGFF